MHIFAEPRHSRPASDDQRQAIREACRLLGGAPKKRRGTFARSVHIDHLEVAGVDRDIMAWMHFQGFVTHYLSKPGRESAVHAGASAVVGSTSCFTLTEAGRAFSALLLAKNRAGDRIALPMGHLTPRYQTVRRERHFTWGVHLLKRFSQPVGNQETILAAVEEENWESELDDPLTGDGIIDAKARLHQTIRDLNRWQKLYFIHFTALGSGTAVGWELR